MPVPFAEIKAPSTVYQSFPFSKRSRMKISSSIVGRTTTFGCQHTCVGESILSTTIRVPAHSAV